MLQGLDTSWGSRYNTDSKCKIHIEKLHLETEALLMDSAKADEQHRPTGEKERPRRPRVHRSMYLERAVYDRLGEAYKTTSHELYPQEVRKSTFVEACIAYALEHLPDIKAGLRKDR